MASIFQNTQFYSNIKDFSAYEYYDESSYSSSGDEYSDYENEIEYSLEQQDKLEKFIYGNNNKSNSLKSSSKSLQIKTSQSNLYTKPSTIPSPSVPIDDNQIATCGCCTKKQKQQHQEKEKENNIKEIKQEENQIESNEKRQ